MTHRQFKAWRRWRREELNEPDRHDHYLMQLAAITLGVHSGHAEPLASFKIPFAFREATPADGREQAEVRARLNKEILVSAVMGAGQRRRRAEAGVGGGPGKAAEPIKLGAAKGR